MPRTSKKMKAVILAAGNSTRCYPLTLTRPKPLLKVANKTILEHTLSSMEGLVDEVIIIVGYRKDMIINAYGKAFGKMKINYVEQKEQLGTGNALLSAEKHIKGRFMLINGDDIYLREDIEELLKHTHGILAAEVEHPEKYGVLTADEDGNMLSLIEKPENPESRLVNIGCYLLDETIFPILKNIKASARGEYEVTSAVSEFAKTKKIAVVRANRWLPMGYPWDLITNNERFVNELTESTIQGTLEENVFIKGFVVVGEDSVIRSGSYIEGPVIIGKNCVIGPNCFIRGSTTIGDNCKVGQAVEIKNSLLMDNSKVPHLSYIGDSIIGENSNMGAGTITANLRHDHGNVKSVVGDALIDTGRRKLGAIIADDVHTGIHTSIYPGRKIWPGKSTKPGELVKEDIVD